MSKNGQAKTKSAQATRVIHVAVPMKLFRSVERRAKKGQRSINWMVRELLQKAVVSVPES